MDEINWDDTGWDSNARTQLNDYLGGSTGNTNYGDVDPPSTGIGGPGTSYTQWLF